MTKSIKIDNDNIDYDEVFSSPLIDKRQELNSKFFLYFNKKLENFLLSVEY